jgi:hypothetical protein
LHRKCLSRQALSLLKELIRRPPMTITDGFLIAATLISPLLAVQVQKFIERATERRTGQKRIFYALMATRATRIAPER